MNRRAGLTLVELQTASVLLGIILVAMGVVLVTALNAVRILNDAHIVYYNALAAMRSFQGDIMRANRYGWSPGGASGPTLAGTNNTLWLRVAEDPLAGGELFQYSVDADNNLILQVGAAERVIATHIHAVSFHKLSYNAVGVTVIAHGDLADEAGSGVKHEALLSGIFNLRGAAADSSEGPTW